MSKGIFNKVKAILSEDFSHHHLSPGGTLSTIERFIHFWVFAIKSFVRNRCMVRASALAYSNLLALVPMLAIAISVSATLLKENGKENQRIDRLITWVVHALVPKGEEKKAEAKAGEEAKSEESLDKTTHDAVKTQINQFINNIRGGALSSSGMILLIVIVILMLARIEDTLNDIWGVKKGRSWFARIITYWFAMTFGPLLLLAAITINSGQQMAAFIEQLSHWPSPFNEIFGFMAKSAPFVLLSIGFSFFYKFMPNTKVQWRAAFVGGICGGTLWQVNNLLFVFYVSRIVTNNKIYGSLGMIPVVMISLYLGWLFLLFGAQFAYAFQNRRAYVQDRLIESLTPRGREVVALRLMTEIAVRFFNGQGPTSADHLADKLGVPSRFIVSIVETLLDDELVFEINEDEPAYLPARPLWTISFADVVEAVRNGISANSSEPIETGGDRVTEEYERLVRREMQSAGKLTLEKIAEELSESETTAPNRNSAAA